MRYILSILAILLLILFTSLNIHAQTAENPLPDCPKSPNCFASKTTAKKWHKKPLPFIGGAEKSIEKLLELLDKIPGAKHKSSDSEEIHYTFETKIGKFIDDVYFSVDSQNQCFHFKSASRKGYSDMGANKRRMKKISRLWQDKSN